MLDGVHFYGKTSGVWEGSKSVVKETGGKWLPGNGRVKADGNYYFGTFDKVKGFSAINKHMGVYYNGVTMHFTKGGKIEPLLCKLSEDQKAVFYGNRVVCPLDVYYRDTSVNKIWPFSYYFGYEESRQIIKPMDYSKYNQYVVMTKLQPGAVVEMSSDISGEYYIHYRWVNYNMCQIKNVYLECNKYKPECELKFHNWAKGLVIDDLHKIQGELTMDRIMLLFEEIDNVECREKVAHRIYDYYKIIIENSMKQSHEHFNRGNKKIE